VTALGPGKDRYDKKWATARKDARCRGCGAPILKGQRYWRVAPGFVPATWFCAPVCDQ